MSETDRLLHNAENHEPPTGAPKRPKVAVVACMDARVDVYRILGLKPGDAHVIRNAGGVITDDEIRSLAISQHMLGSQEVLVILHTDCGMLGITDEEFAERMEREAGQRPPWPARTFTDLDEEARAGVRAIVDSPFIPNKESVRGFVYDVDSGELREVASA